MGVESDDESYLNDTKHPLNIGLYLQDRMEWRGVVVLAGLRFDMYNYNALTIADPKDPFGGNDVLDDSDLVDSEDFKRLSPRLGISFPVTDQTQMHINFGKFFQRPDLNRLYVGYDFLQDRVTAGSYSPFSNPALTPEKITQYEVGMTHQLSENVAFSTTAYYKDVQDLVQIAQVSGAVPRAYDHYTNLDFGTIKGVDLALVMRRSRNVRLDLRYTLSYANGTGSYANTNYVNRWQGATAAKTTNPLDYDQRHSFNALVDFRTSKGEGPRLGDVFPLENLSLNVILTAGSGTPYTPAHIYDEATENAVFSQPIGRINAANKPWIYNIDVKLQKDLMVAGHTLTPYVWVKNLLDRENVIGVYESTGKANTDGYLDTNSGQTTIATVPGYKERYELKEFNPTNWSAPRQIFVGLRASF
jgi:outer membrane receptor protein involved in Fe transport